MARVEIKTREDIKTVLDQNYITIKDFAGLVGVRSNYMSRVIHGHNPMGRLIRIRIQRAADQLAENPPEVPQGKILAPTGA